MTIKDFFESKEKLVIRCNAEEKATALLRAFNKAGYRWADGTAYSIYNTCWKHFKEETCYSNDRQYANRKFYQAMDYKILEFEDIDTKERY